MCAVGRVLYEFMIFRNLGVFQFVGLKMAVIYGQSVTAYKDFQIQTAVSGVLKVYGFTACNRIL